MSDWNPALYLRFAEERTRPASELLARVAHPGPTHVVDLGCGPGNSTELLLQRFPQARILGIDNSAAMLAEARQRLPQLAFDQADIADWAPSQAPDLIYANAALQWVGGHEQLIPRLFAALAPGGVLAIQMPDNFEEPSHRLMREVAGMPAFAAHIDVQTVRGRFLRPIHDYYDLLANHAAQVDVWHTIYQHPMADAQAIVQWLRSTGLKPFVESLPQALQTAFLEEYERRVAQAYPARADGRRLLAFPRMFIVARRAP
ncbi:trans-aconitate 2-methyltransferase [Acidovorax sp. Be4]|uniref:Trans-aconitate 2-methyltransferase n=1 Tax=Acidovorax bellezanensis TaxID=2976702 RepID=A0ABT2PQW7_9BURK|nr:trans-aconitate 2-methyltransferase [Acidovorax sp. Be4]MCT9812862.1 trans-aconitate 2-methyltransferase [Acidovorax sp. Be4]